MTDAKIEELSVAFFNAKGSPKKLEAVCREAMNLAETLTAQLSSIRDAGDVEVERLTNEIQYQLRTVDIIKLRDIAIARGQQLREARVEIERMKNLLRWCAGSMNRHSELDEAAAEGEGLAAEVLAAIQKQGMEEVDALWAMWLKTRPPDDEPVVEDLVDLARQTILAYEREKRRVDEAEKEARRVECCTCGHEMVEVDGQFGCEHCDHEYDQTCECPNCHQTRERESAQSRIATLTSERDELESMRKEDIKAVLCLQSEIERLLAKVEHKKQQLEIDAVNQAAEWAKESGA